MSPDDAKPGFACTRRHLPHWTTEGATYFMTARLRTKPLNASETEFVKGEILSGDAQFYDLVAVQVMPDHFHALLRSRTGYPLSRVMKGIKGTSARRLNLMRGTRGRVWQEESFDRSVRDERGFREKIEYMYLNSVKAGLTQDPDHYPGWYLRRE